MLHLGVSGSFRRYYTFQLKCSVSDNYGTYNSPFSTNVRQFSSILTVGFPVHLRSGLQATASLAVDEGRLYTNSTGLYVSLRKTWNQLPKQALKAK